LSAVFRDYDQAALDAQYDQRAWAPDMDTVIARYAARSDDIRARFGEPVTHAYGASAVEKLDVYGGADRKQTFVFVHGGAWRRESRRASAYAAEPVLRAGAAYVALGFAAIPAVSLPEMAQQVCNGIDWVMRHLGSRVVLCGHSSGAHLAACALTRVDGIARALLVSGLYDLMPVRLSARNDYVKLDARLEQALSPLRHRERIRCPVQVAWAEKDSAEFIRQSREFAAALRAPTLEGKALDHFTMAETLADPASPLARAALAMLE
jgi:arylformamidase